MKMLLLIVHRAEGLVRLSDLATREVNESLGTSDRLAAWTTEGEQIQVLILRARNALTYNDIAEALRPHLTGLTASCELVCFTHGPEGTGCAAADVATAAKILKCTKCCAGEFRRGGGTFGANLCRDLDSACDTGAGVTDFQFPPWDTLCREGCAPPRVQPRTALGDIRHEMGKFLGPLDVDLQTLADAVDPQEHWDEIKTAWKDAWGENDVATGVFSRLRTLVYEVAGTQAARIQPLSAVVEAASLTGSDDWSEVQALLPPPESGGEAGGEENLLTAAKTELSEVLTASSADAARDAAKKERFRAWHVSWVRALDGLEAALRSVEVPDRQPGRDGLGQDPE